MSSEPTRDMKLQIGHVLFIDIVALACARTRRLR